MLPIIGQVIVSGLLLGGVYALISIGLTLIFGVSRITNFAHGEFVTLGMYATYWLFVGLGVDPYLSLIIVIPLMFFLGLGVARTVIKPIIGAPPVAQIFATVGISLVIQNVALLLWGADYRSINTFYSEIVFRLGWLNFPLPLVIAFGVAMGITLALHLFLRFTYVGKAIRAVAQDREATSMTIDVDSIDLLTFSIGICLAGVGGTLLMPIYPVFPTVGQTLVIIAFVVVVLGGLGSVGGALLGGLAIGIIETVSGFYMGTALRQIVYFIVFVFVLLMMPAGFFGQRGAEEIGFKE